MVKRSNLTQFFMAHKIQHHPAIALQLRRFTSVVHIMRIIKKYAADMPQATESDRKLQSLLLTYLEANQYTTTTPSREE